MKCALIHLAIVCFILTTSSDGECSLKSSVRTLSKAIEKKVAGKATVETNGNMITITFNGVDRIFKVLPSGPHRRKSEYLKLSKPGSFKVMIRAVKKLSPETQRRLIEWNKKTKAEIEELLKEVKHTKGKGSIEFKPRNSKEKEIQSEIQRLQSQHVDVPNIYWSNLSLRISANADYVFPESEAAVCTLLLNEVISIFRKYDKKITRDIHLHGNVPVSF